jgi:hypothetical protein
MGVIVSLIIVALTDLSAWYLVAGAVLDLACSPWHGWEAHDTLAMARARAAMAPVRAIASARTAYAADRAAEEARTSMPSTLAPLIDLARGQRIDAIEGDLLERAVAEKRADQVEAVSSRWQRLRPDDTHVQARCEEARDRVLDGKRGLEDIF